MNLPLPGEWRRDIAVHDEPMTGADAPVNAAPG